MKMDHSLLQSKFHIPHVKFNLVSRPRLLQMLDAGLDKKLIILSAPAGFGKTTLLSEWLKGTACRSAWLSIDDDDNDPVRFHKYLIGALQKLDSHIDDTALELLHSPQPVLQSAALTTLINQMEEIQSDSILVLDDFHLISEPSIHQSIEYLLNYLPANFHLVLSTRADPPLSYSRLRAQGELIEIRMNDLKFTVQEVKEFFANETAFLLSEQSMIKLADRTEGWISGLQMASLSLRGKTNAEEFVESFSGSHKFVLDYLFQEVLTQQPEEIHQFLLMTSILDRLCGPLCDHILETKNSQQVLEQLERENLFLIPLDDERGWYRYHQLFKDLLSHRLSLAYTDRVPLLFRKASDWHAESGERFLAIDYAFEGGENALALELILSEAETTLIRGEVNTFHKWVSQLPAELQKANPEIKFFHIWSKVLMGGDFDDMLSRIEKGGVVDVKPGRVDTLMAFIYVSKGEFALAGEHAHHAMNSLDEADTYFRGIAAWLEGIFLALQYNVQGSIERLEGLSTTIDLDHNPMLNVLISSQVARAQSRLGNFQKAEEIYQQALEKAKDRQGNLIPIAGEALMGLGDLYREQNRLNEATDTILDGIELTQQWRKAAAIEGYIFLARVKQLEQNWPSANKAMETALRLAVEYDALDIDDRMVEMWQARMWCFEGKLDQVEEWVSKLDLDAGIEDIVIDKAFRIENYIQARERTTLARFYLCSAKYEEALYLSQQLMSIFRNYGRMDMLIELNLIMATGYDQLGQREQSIGALKEAIRLGEAGGFLGTFLEAGAEIAELIEIYLRDIEDSEFVNQVLETVREKPAFREEIAQPLPDPLSDRELDVLRYLPSNLTTPEIAKEMLISINTVRTHIKNIYQKLGVHRRSEAVTRARDLGIK